MGPMGLRWSMRSVKMLSRPRAVILALLVLVSAGAVVAVVGRGSTPTSTHPLSTGVMGESAKQAGPGTDAAAPGRVAADHAPAPSATNATPGGGGQSDVAAGPRVVRTAEVTVGVAAGAFSRAFDGITSAVTAQGGYVTASSASTGSGSVGPDGSTVPATGDRSRHPRSGDLTLRVPADRFDAVRSSLAGLGTVEQEQLRGEDVTAQIVDYDARLKSLQAEEEALRTLVGRATAVGEVLQVQSQLFDVRQQVERVQAQRDQLDQQASLATIHVALHEPGASFEVPQPATGLARAWERAVAGSVAIVGGTIVVLGWLAPVAVVGLLAWAVLRLRRRGGAQVQPGPSVV